MCEWIRDSTISRAKREVGFKQEKEKQNRAKNGQGKENAAAEMARATILIIGPSVQWKVA